jgi:hypothetical protein
MFQHLTGEARRNLTLLCCDGEHCDGDDKVFYNCVPALDDIDGKVAVWVRLGRDETYVMDPTPQGKGQWRVRERLR